MTEEKKPTYAELLKNINKTTRVAPGLAKQVQEAKFKTFGCGSAIASSSLVTEMIRGKTLDEAGAIKNTVIAQELELPPVKIHCSMLAEDAIKAAIADYLSKKEAGSSQA
jgi:nitrogen fixation NifU-like protein